MVHLIKGTIQSYNNWIMCWVDNELIEYYRSLLPKYWYVQPPRTKAHISIVRQFERPNRFNWRKYDGEPIDILYYSGIRYKYPYFWLDCECDKILQIRREVELPDYLGLHFSYHITVGNLK